MRIGVAGVGRIGAMHAANLATLEQVEELLLFDPIAGRAAAAAEALGGRVGAADDLEALLAASDGVLLATPTDTHPGMLHRCTAARVPTLCEKPIAGDLATMRELVGEIEASGVEVLVGFQRRFDPAIAELYRRIRAGEVGKIYLVKAAGNDAAPPELGYLPSSGGIFRDLLIHDLDAVPWLVGEPVVEVYASGSVLVHDAFTAADDVDNAVVTLRFASGAHAVLVAGRHDPLGYDHRIEVLGSKDSLAVGLDPRTPLSSLEPDGPRVAADAYPGFAERFRNAYLNEMAVFVDVVAGRAANPSPARDSLLSLQLAEACETSRRSGSPVRVMRQGGFAGFQVSEHVTERDSESALVQLKVAGAPISWGVCEVPAWGHVLPPEEVLGSMAALGLTATELGPRDYLPSDPQQLRLLLKQHSLDLVGGFLAIVLHDIDRIQSTVEQVREYAATLAVAGGEVLVLAAATGLDGYDERPRLSDSEWRTLVTAAQRVRDVAAEHRLHTVLHPHVGTHIQTADEVDRFLADCELQLCLDTGHLLVGGADPVHIVASHPHRIGHVHFKDVRADIAAEVRAGRTGYAQAVRDGMYIPLSDGDVDVAAIVRHLSDANYRGWYVLEQDTALGPNDSVRTVEQDVARSLHYLNRLLGR